MKTHFDIIGKIKEICDSRICLISGRGGKYAIYTKDPEHKLLVEITFFIE